MNDQFRQDPEEELPEWLKELRNRGSIEANDGPSDLSESDDFNEASDELDQPDEIEAMPSIPENDSSEFESVDDEAVDDGAPEDEPDWLKEIRLRHEKENDDLPPKKEISDSIPDEAIASEESLEEGEYSHWAPQGEQPSSAPILEIPVQPPQSDENESLSAEESEPAVQELSEESSESFDETLARIFPDREKSSADPPSDESEEWELADSEEESAKAQALSEFLGEESSDADEIEAVKEIIEESPASPPLSANVAEALALASDALEDLHVEESEDTGELMTWLADDDEVIEEEKAVSAFPASEESELAPAELPSWLAALKPGQAKDQPIEDEVSEVPDIQEEEQFEEGQERVGPLAGLSGIIPAEPEIVQLGRAKIPTGQLEFSANQQQHVANLERLLAREGAPIEDHGQRIALPMRVLQMLFAALLFIATLFPLVTGSQIASRPPLGSVPESTAFFNQIELLPANVPVLIAFEVQPALYGEMKAIAVTVLSHLLEKEARLTFISTQPTGPALVERLLAEEFGDNPGIVNDEYVNLGYLSGGTAALRYFATNPRQATILPLQWQAPGLENIDHISNFGIVLTITGDAEDARAWIEQVSPHTSDGLFSLASAQAAPLLLPYLESDPVTIRSLVSGLSGAAYYESLRNQDGIGRDYWDAYSYGVGAILILILMGGLYGRLIRLRPEKNRGNKESQGSNG